MKTNNLETELKCLIILVVDLSHFRRPLGEGDSDRNLDFVCDVSLVFGHGVQ